MPQCPDSSVSNPSDEYIGDLHLLNDLGLALSFGSLPRLLGLFLLRLDGFCGVHQISEPVGWCSFCFLLCWWLLFLQNWSGVCLDLFRHRLLNVRNWRENSLLRLRDYIRSCLLLGSGLDRLRDLNMFLCFLGRQLLLFCLLGFHGLPLGF